MFSIYFLFDCSQSSISFLGCYKKFELISFFNSIGDFDPDDYLCIPFRFEGSNIPSDFFDLKGKDYIWLSSMHFGLDRLGFLDSIISQQSSVYTEV